MEFVTAKMIVELGVLIAIAVSYIISSNRKDKWMMSMLDEEIKDHNETLHKLSENTENTTKLLEVLITDVRDIKSNQERERADEA